MKRKPAKMGRPALGANRQLTIHLTSDQMHYLNSLSREGEVTLSEAMRQIIQMHRLLLRRGII